MKVTALAPWFGSKRTLAPTIIEAIGPHRVYWEPFCGSMSVLLAKPPCVMETVNDLHGHLVNLARIIQHPTMGPALYRRLRRVLFTEAQFDSERERVTTTEPGDELDPDSAFAYFLTSWCGRNGVAGTSSYNSGFCVRYTANGCHAATRWRSAVGSIPAWKRRLANVTILRRDAFALIERIEDAEGTAIYVDPPYIVKGAKYRHDLGQADHERLAIALRRFKLARVVVSYYEHPELARLYAGWSKRDHATTKALVNQGMREKRGATKAPEVLIVNEPGGLWT